MLHTFMHKSYTLLTKQSDIRLYLVPTYAVHLRFVLVVRVYVAVPCIQGEFLDNI